MISSIGAVYFFILILLSFLRTRKFEDYGEGFERRGILLKKFD
jgi:hypothetical protein